MSTSRRSLRIAGVVVLLGLALLLPAGRTAATLTGRTPPPEAVVTGVWIFRALAAFHGLLLAATLWTGRREGAPAAGGPPGADAGAGAPPPGVTPIDAAGRPGAGGPVDGPVAEGGVAGRPVVGGRVANGRVVEDDGTVLATVHRMGVAMLVLAALVVRLPSLGSGLWFDEIHTLVAYASRPLGEVITTYDSQNQHLLYSVLARITTLLSGDGALGVRLPALLFGVGSLLALDAFGRRITGRRETLLSIALLVFSYHHVWFSQNARGYTGLLFFTLVGSCIFLDMLRPGIDGWPPGVLDPMWFDRMPVAHLRPLLYGIVMGLAVATQLAAVFVVAAHGLVWLAALASGRGPERPWRQLGGFVLAGTVSLQLYALVLPQLLSSFVVPAPPPGAAGAAAASSPWQDPLWFLAETAEGLARGAPGGWVGLAAAAVVGVAGVVAYLRQSPWIVAVMVTPAVVTGVALLALERNLWPRFFFFGMGFGALVVMRGVAALADLVGGWIAVPEEGRRATAAALSVAVVVASAVTVPRAWRPKQDYRSARAVVESVAAPDDAVVAVGMAAYPFDVWLNTGWPRVDALEELLSLERDHARTWVVYTFPTRLEAVQPAIAERLRSSYRVEVEVPGNIAGGAIVIAVHDGGQNGS